VRRINSNVLGVCALRVTLLGPEAYAVKQQQRQMMNSNHTTVYSCVAQCKTDAQQSQLPSSKVPDAQASAAGNLLLIMLHSTGHMHIGSVKLTAAYMQHYVLRV
jgi:hypothetical protein